MLGQLGLLGGWEHKGAPSHEAVIATTNGGATWKFETLPKVPDGMGQYAAISCTSAKDFVFAGIGVLTTTDGGESGCPGR